ncbi:hypothetical protein EB796_017540 [Bugula neritina]|uniref:Uncharacterized protein n=1 Tax=Bugula neritina TaxID=10212 RepID=A0A7J7JDH5_BUGNE|nr:hypothetical protein EB796_017540 [Bugula neritina]
MNIYLLVMECCFIFVLIFLQRYGRINVQLDQLKIQSNCNQQHISHHTCITLSYNNTLIHYCSFFPPQPYQK